MDFVTLARNIQELVSEVSLIVIKQRINIRRQQIFKMREWEFLRKTVLVATADEYDTGTISISVGGTTVTGAGTTFTAAMVGRSLYVGTTHSQPYIISAFTSTTDITIETAFAPLTASSGDDYSIKALRYTPSVADIAKIDRIVYDRRKLIEKPHGYFDAIDPERTTTGVPIFYSIAKKSAQSGTITFEVHPVPNGEYVMKVVYYRKAVDLSANDDDLVIDAELIEAAVLWDCYRIFAAKNPAYIGLARDAKVDFHSSLSMAIEQDLEQASLPDKVIDASEIGDALTSDAFLLDHDLGI